jgi:hypothetical protein
MTRAKPAPDKPQPLPTAGGSYIREADGSLTLVPDGPDPAPLAIDDLTEAPADVPAEKEA